MENTIEIKSWFNNKVIFLYTCENNTIGKTVEDAVNGNIFSLAYANLYQADLSNTNLFNADLFRANLNGANLSNSNLSCAFLRQANLNRVNLIGADLSGADLVYSNLTNADLSGANLTNANLNEAYLKYVNFTNAVGINDQCPKTGSFIGWKKCFDRNNKTFCVVKLEIPADAKRSSATTNKCRCSKAKVLEIQNIDGTKADIDHVFSTYDCTFKYKVNEYVYPNSFDDSFWVECGHGIHFFMNREDAVNY